MAEGQQYGVKKGIIFSLGGIVAIVVMIGGIAYFLMYRVVVPSGSIGIVKAMTGKSLPADRILAKEGEKGIREDFLSPGRYYFNPWFYKIEIKPEINIPGGKFGVI